MSQISGVIEEISSVKSVSKAGRPYTKWYLHIDGEKVGAGLSRPTGFSEGDNVTVEVETKYGELQLVASASPTTGRTPNPKSRRANGSAAGPSAAFPVAKDSNGMSICRQSALKAAVEVVDMYVRLNDEAVGMTIDDLKEMVIDTAYEFTDFSTGEREVKLAKSMLKEMES